MKEGLISNDRQMGERQMLDLNKMASSDSPPPSDYFLAEEGVKDVDSSVHMEATGNADAGDDGKGREEVNGKGEKNSTSIDGDTSGGLAGEEESCLPPSNADSIREEMRKAEIFGCGKDAATCGVVDIALSGGGADLRSQDVGKKRQGRKRKVVESGLLNDGSLESDSVKESAKSAKVVENGSKLQVSNDGQDADMHGGVSADAGDNNLRQDARKGRRGRKRKVPESSGGNKDGRTTGKQTVNLTPEDSPQIIRRVLRSRIVAETVCEKNASSKETAEISDREVEMGVDSSCKRSAKKEIDESAQPTRRGTKKLRGRCGRLPKLHGKKGILKMTINKKVKVGSQKRLNLPRAVVVKGSVPLKVHKEKGTSASGKALQEKNKRKKEGEMGRKVEKQLLKNQIISMLKGAGWTIEYRPRMNRECVDTVYVDHRGRTYWSVTLAYKKLKQMVEDETTDAKAVSAFTPIPEDKLSILFRITKSEKPARVRGRKTRKGGTRENPDKKSASGSIAVSRGKENLISRPNHGQRSSKKETREDSCEQEDSVVFSSRRNSKSKKAGGRNPRALLARSAENGSDRENDSFKAYKGKRTLLAWLIDRGAVSPGDKVQYISQQRRVVSLRGKITGDGICCDCCDKVVSYLDFGAHAGSTLGQPYKNIYLESGHSLLQCMTESWTEQEMTDSIGFRFVNIDGDPNDDTCNICADGGDLICCDGCPSTFHQSCLQIQNCPSGAWHCMFCSCKFCGIVCGRGSQNMDFLDMNDSESFTCRFCEEKFHVHCRKGKETKDVNTEDISFCGRGCQKLFENLQKLLGVRHELEGGYSWTVLRRQDVNQHASPNADSSKIECNFKLAIALSIMDECFLPIIDQRSNINIIQSVLYSCGSNFRRLNCSSFYTFILERGDELVSAAAIRVHGNQLAEMPFIGTRPMYRRQGMCRRLLTAIEMALSALSVKKLVIPAISELNETWTKIFGFLPLEESKRQEMKYMNMIAFPGTDMLQKLLWKDQSTQEKITSGADMLQKLLCKDQSTQEKITSATGLGTSQPANVKGDTNSILDFDASAVFKLKQNAKSQAAHKTSSDLNDESIPISLSGDSLPNDPQPCTISSKLSGNNLCSGGSFFHSSSHPEVV